MGIQKSDIVLSIAGRDRGDRFAAIDTACGFVWLADGKGRRIEKPRQKKLRHLRHVCSCGGPEAEKLRMNQTVTNKELRLTLKALYEPRGSYIGGMLNG